MKISRMYLIDTNAFAKARDLKSALRGLAIAWNNDHLHTVKSIAHALQAGGFNNREMVKLGNLRKTLNAIEGDVFDQVGKKWRFTLPGKGAK